MSESEVCVILLRAGWLEKFAEREDGSCWPFWTFKGKNLAWFWRLIYINLDLSHAEEMGLLLRVIHGREKAPEKWTKELSGATSKALSFYLSSLPDIFQLGDIEPLKTFSEICVRWAPVGDKGI